MDRRRYLDAAAGGLAGLVGLAGCADLFGPGEPSGGTTASPDPTSSDTQRTPTATTAVPDATTTGDDDRSPKRLRVSSQADATLDVTIVLTVASDGERVYDRTRTFVPGDVFVVHNLFERGVDYRLAIRIEGDLVFERVVRSYQAYELVIRSATTVTVGEKHET